MNVHCTTYRACSKVNARMASMWFTKCYNLLVLISFMLFSCTTAMPITKRYDSIKEVNRKGPYIGLITVFPPEETAFFATGAFKPHPKHPILDLSGRRFRIGKIHDKKVIYVRCGIGMVNAVAATQQMVDMFDLVGIVHFGIAGNVNDSMSIADVTIPKQIAHTGIWDWLNPNRTLGSSYVAQLDIKNYNVPKEGDNLLGHIGYNNEEFYSTLGRPNVAKPLFWGQIDNNLLHIASKLEGIKLKQCVNASLCLPEKPKLVVGLNGSTANIFMDNAAYRDFLFQTFKVSSVDMESAAVVMTSMSNGIPVIVIRGLSDLAGGQSGHNDLDVFGSLASQNTAKVVVSFIKEIPRLAVVLRS